jgi:two-component system response regulator BaeR
MQQDLSAMTADRRHPILIVEDQPKLAKVLKDYLEESGYKTDWLADGSEVVPWVKANSPELILLDIMLPGKDGMSVCRELRMFTNVPVIMVTAKVEEIDRLLGLELGADDYICKPFSPREVVARIKAILRRVNVADNTLMLATRLVLDPEKYTATLDGQSLDLTPIEFRLLEALQAQPGRVYSRDRLLDVIYEDHRVVTDRTVDSHIKNLRRKIQSVCSEDLIRSIYGVGYKLEI